MVDAVNIIGITAIFFTENNSAIEDCVVKYVSIYIWVNAQGAFKTVTFLLQWDYIDEIPLKLVTRYG